MLPTLKCRTRPQTRRAVAAAETAICLPLIAMLLLASIEAAGMIYLNHSLAIASYEGIRVGINFDGTTPAVTKKCNELINHRKVVDGTITVDPADVANVPRGTPITVTVSAPSEPNSLLPPWFFGGKTISASTVMVKE